LTGGVLAGRYAEALIDIALEEKAEEKIKGELTGFLEIFEGSDLKKVFLDPSCTLEDKLGILGEIGAKLGLSGTLTNFLSLLMENKRMGQLKDINDAFQDILDAKLGRVRADVSLPLEPAASEVEGIRKALEKSTGKKVVMDISVDPNILGGVVAKVGSTIYDGSLKTQINNLKKSIMRG